MHSPSLKGKYVSFSSRAPLIVFSAAFLLVGAIFIYIGGDTLLEQQRYRQQGVEVEAVVTGKALRPATTSTETAYEISYQFNLPEGEPYQQTESVSVPFWERVEPGSSLTVEYVAGVPASARVMAGDDANENNSAIAALAVGAVLVLLVPIGWFVLLKRGRSRRATAPEMVEPAVEASNVAAMHQQSFWPIARRSSGFWFGGFALLFGLPWLAVNGIVPVHANWRFAHEGVATRGIVLAKEIRSSGRGSNRTQHYEATYEFAVQGKTIEGRDELSQEDWERLMEREPAGVLYLAGKPSSNRLVGHRPWFMKSLFGLIGLVLTLLGSIVFLRTVRNARLELHLRQYGVRAPGTVTALEDLNLKLNGAQQWQLHFDYSDFQGHRHVMKFDLAQHEAQAWKVGDVGEVLFDPTRPTEAIWIGRPQVREP